MPQSKTVRPAEPAGPGGIQEIPQQMLKTAQILRRFNFTEWGGTENVVWNTIGHLRSHNISSEILATRAESSGDFEERDGVPIRRFDFFYPYWPLSAEAKAALDRRGGDPVSFALYRHLATSNYNLLHVHTPGRLARIALRAARKRNIPYILSFHKGSFNIPEAEKREMLAPLRGTIPLGGLLDVLCGWRSDCVNGATGVICVGETQAGLLREKYPSKRIIHLHNGVDPDKFNRPVNVDIRREFGIPESRKILLCVSRIDAQKNQKLLLRLTSALTEDGENVHALLIGPTHATYYAEELQQLAKKLSICDRLTIIPGLGADDERLIAAYQAAEVFVLPSLDEPFGIVVLEAWSAGIPVLASAVGGLKQLVRDGVNGLLFESDNLTSLLEAYRTLEPPGIGDPRVANARREVRARYSWETVSSRLAEFYRECVEEMRS